MLKPFFREEKKNVEQGTFDNSIFFKYPVLFWDLFILFHKLIQILKTVDLDSENCGFGLVPGGRGGEQLIEEIPPVLLSCRAASQLAVRLLIHSHTAIITNRAHRTFQSDR
jgi:hypothetical protein